MLGFDFTQCIYVWKHHNVLYKYKLLCVNKNKIRKRSQGEVMYFTFKLCISNYVSYNFHLMLLKKRERNAFITIWIYLKTYTFLDILFT